MTLVEREWQVPLDHDRPDGEQITVFAREVVSPSTREERPWLVFLQGGPGSASPRPPITGLWLPRALLDYRVLLLDQRGTGRSTPVTHQTLARLPGPEAQADYLAHFRADAIVRDCELVRRQLTGGAPWAVFGQSFGGFCAATYLSFAPEGLTEVLVAGGLPPLTRTADDVYRATYRRMRERNRLYFERYPEDAARLLEVVERLEREDVRLPSGDRLTSRRLRQRGMVFGSGHGFERVHYLLESPFVDGGRGSEVDERFLAHVAQADPFDLAPLYALVHEAIYAQGAATRWAAHRVLAEFPEFADDARPPLLLGEMVFPWNFGESSALRPLRETAELLAERDDWPPLYDLERLAANEVPVAAVLYDDDPYVDRVLQEEAAAAIRGCRTWVTNEHLHDGIELAPERVLGRLIALARGDA
jgi:pimeloyl-ACP methyl ester carboxylesterase